MSENKKNIEWIYDITSLIRKKIKKEYDTTSKKDGLFLQYFRKPCQFVKIDVKEINTTFLFLFNDNNNDDKKTTYNNVDDINDLFNYIENNIFNTLPKKLSIKIAYYLDKILADGDLDDVKDNFFSYLLVPYPEIDVCVLFYSTQYINKKPDIVLDDWINTVKKSIENIEAEDIDKGTVIGVSWYPPILLNEINISFKGNKGFSHKYKGYPIFITDLGHLWIKVSDKPWDYLSDKQKIALDIFNEIITVANIYDIKGMKIKSDELCFGIIDNNTNNILSVMYSLDSSRHSMIYQFQDESRWYVHAYEKDVPEIPIKKLVKIFKIAESVSTNKRINTYLQLYLDICSHYYVKENVPTFLFGWIFIEKYITEIWELMLQDKNLNRNRYDKLTGIFWGMDDILETLNLMKIMSNSRYQAIMTIKKARNKLLHDEVQPDISIINSELELIKELVKNILDEHLQNTHTTT